MASNLTDDPSAGLEGVSTQHSGADHSSWDEWEALLFLALEAKDLDISSFDADDFRDSFERDATEAVKVALGDEELRVSFGYSPGSVIIRMITHFPEGRYSRSDLEPMAALLRVAVTDGLLNESKDEYGELTLHRDVVAKIVRHTEEEAAAAASPPGAGLSANSDPVMPIIGEPWTAFDKDSMVRAAAEEEEAPEADNKGQKPEPKAINEALVDFALEFPDLSMEDLQKPLGFGSVVDIFKHDVSAALGALSGSPSTAVTRFSSIEPGSVVAKGSVHVSDTDAASALFVRLLEGGKGVLGASVLDQWGPVSVLHVTAGNDVSAMADGSSVSGAAGGASRAAGTPDQGALLAGRAQGSDDAGKTMVLISGGQWWVVVLMAVGIALIACLMLLSLYVMSRRVKLRRSDLHLSNSSGVGTSDGWGGSGDVESQGAISAEQQRRQQRRSRRLQQQQQEQEGALRESTASTAQGPSGGCWGHRQASGASPQAAELAGDVRSSRVCNGGAATPAVSSVQGSAVTGPPLRGSAEHQEGLAGSTSLPRGVLLPPRDPDLNLLASRASTLTGTTGTGAGGSSSAARESGTLDITEAPLPGALNGSITFSKPKRDHDLLSSVLIVDTNPRVVQPPRARPSVQYSSTTAAAAAVCSEGDGVKAAASAPEAGEPLRSRPRSNRPMTTPTRLSTETSIVPSSGNFLREASAGSAGPYLPPQRHRAVPVKRPWLGADEKEPPKQLPPRDPDLKLMVSRNSSGNSGSTGQGDSNAAAAGVPGQDQRGSVSAPLHNCSVSTVARQTVSSQASHQDIGPLSEACREAYSDSFGDSALEALDRLESRLEHELEAIAARLSVTTACSGTRAAVGPRAALGPVDASNESVATGGVSNLPLASPESSAPLVLPSAARPRRPPPLLEVVGSNGNGKAMMARAASGGSVRARQLQRSAGSARSTSAATSFPFSENTDPNASFTSHPTSSVGPALPSRQPLVSPAREPLRTLGGNQMPDNTDQNASFTSHRTSSAGPALPSRQPLVSPAREPLRPLGGNKRRSRLKPSATDSENKTPATEQQASPDTDPQTFIRGPNDSLVLWGSPPREQCSPLDLDGNRLNAPEAPTPVLSDLPLRPPPPAKAANRPGSASVTHLAEQEPRPRSSKQIPTPVSSSHQGPFTSWQRSNNLMVTPPVFLLPYMPPKPPGGNPLNLPPRRLGFSGFHVSGIIENPTFRSSTGSLPSPGGSSFLPSEWQNHISPAMPLREKYGRAGGLRHAGTLQSSASSKKVPGPRTPLTTRPLTRSKTGASRLGKSVSRPTTRESTVGGVMHATDEPPSKRKEWRRPWKL